MTIPQIKGPWRSIALIILMVPIGGVANKSINGEIHTLTDVWSTLAHGLPVAIGLACGWIFFSSPWAPELQGLLHQQSSRSSVSPTGATVLEKSDLLIIPPAAPPVASPESKGEK